MNWNTNSYPGYCTRGMLINLIDNYNYGNRITEICKTTKGLTRLQFSLSVLLYVLNHNSCSSYVEIRRIKPTGGMPQTNLRTEYSNKQLNHCIEDVQRKGSPVGEETRLPYEVIFRKIRKTRLTWSKEMDLIWGNDRIEKYCIKFKYFKSVIEKRGTCKEKIETRVAIKKQESRT